MQRAAKNHCFFFLQATKQTWRINPFEKNNRSNSNFQKFNQNPSYLACKFSSGIIVRSEIQESKSKLWLLKFQTLWSFLILSALHYINFPYSIFNKTKTPFRKNIKSVKNTILPQKNSTRIQFGSYKHFMDRVLTRISFSTCFVYMLTWLTLSVTTSSGNGRWDFIFLSFEF